MRSFWSEWKKKASKAEPGRHADEVPAALTESVGSIAGRGLNIWYQPANASDAIVDIVFVHGLTGDATSTWQAKDASQPWPKRKLAADLPDARIMTYGYDADIVHLARRASQNTILEHSRNLLTRLINVRDGESSERRPLMFIAHSLGGLVCEKTLLLSSESPDHDTQNIWRCTFGIVFMGTPHQGSDLAPVASRLAAVLDLNPSKKVNRTLLLALSKDSTELANIQDQFISLAAIRQREGGTLRVHCFAEELPVMGIGRVVVEKASSKFPAGYHDFNTVRADHMEMTKIQETSDDDYGLLLGILNRWIRQNVSRRPGDGTHMVTNVDDPRLGTAAFYCYPTRIRHFVHRDTILARIENIFRTASRSASRNPPTVVLFGMGGTGKTQLALEYCSRAETQKAVWAIFWANAASQATMEESFDLIWETVKQRNEPSSDLSLQRKLLSVKNLLAGWSRPWLLVLDNYDDYVGFPNIQNFVPTGSKGKILITSRRGDLDRHDLGTVIPVGTLDEEPAIQLLLSRARIQDPDSASNREVAKSIVHRLGRLPLAIDQAAAYILARKSTIHEFLIDFEKCKEEILKTFPDGLTYRKMDPTRGESLQSVFTTWELSFQMLRDDQQLPRDVKGYMLTFFSHLDYKRISEELFTKPMKEWDIFSNHGSVLRRIPPEWLSHYLPRGREWDLSVLRNLLAELTTLVLIQDFSRSQDKAYRQFSLHPLVSDWMKLRTSQTTREQCFLLAVLLVKSCALAHLGATEGDLLSLSSHGEIQLLQHVAALESEAVTQVKSGEDTGIYSALIPELQSMSSEIRALRSEKGRQSLRDLGQWLSDFDFKDFLERKYECGIAGTGQWFFANEHFKKWRSLTTATRTLLIVGMPGFGKSVLSAQIFKLLRHSPSEDGVAVLYITFDFLDFTPTLFALIGSFLKQMLSTRSASAIFEDELEELKKLQMENPSPESSPLRRILMSAAAKLHKCYIIVDALDVCDLRTLPTLLEVFNDLGPTARFVVTSRPSPHVLSHMESLQDGYDLIDLEAAQNTDDLLEYIYRRAAHSPALRKLGPELIKAVAEKANGIFSSAELLLNQLEQGEGTATPRLDVEPIVQLYDRILEQIVKTLGTRDLELVVKTMSWMIHSQRLVPLKWLLPVFYPDVPGSSVNECGQLVASMAPGFLDYDADADTFRFVHLTVRDYISLHLDKPPMSRYNHAFFAKLCLDYLLSPEFAEVQHDTPLGLKDLVFEHEFLNYAAVYWGEHVRLYSQSEQTEDASRKKELTQLSVKLLTQGRYLKLSLSVGQLLKLSEEGINHPLIELWTKSSALHVAATFGLLDVVKILVTQHRENANCRDHKGNTAIQSAQSRGFTAVSEYLKQVSAAESGKL